MYTSTITVPPSHHLTPCTLPTPNVHLTNYSSPFTPPNPLYTAHTQCTPHQLQFPLHTTQPLVHSPHPMYTSPITVSPSHHLTPFTFPTHPLDDPIPPPHCRHIPSPIPAALVPLPKISFLFHCLGSTMGST